MDFDLLQIVKHRDAYNRFQPFVKDHTLTKEGLKLYTAMGEYYKSFPGTKEIDWRPFESWFISHKSRELTKENTPTYKAIIAKLRTEPPSIAADDLLENFIRHDYAAKIANEAVKKGDADIDLIAELCKGYDKEVGRAIDKSTLFVTDGEEVALSTDPGLEWRLEELNISCGPLRQGDFVIVGARPESGKTTFLASEVSYMGQQMAGKHTRPIVWVNNEERSTKVKRRIVQAALGITLKDYQADPAKAQAEYEKLMGMKDRILVTGSNAGLNSATKLVSVLRDLNPALIVFDQLDKVAGFERKSDKEDQRLGDLYEWARTLAHEYGPVITASQASDSAEGQQWIFQNQLRGSRTDKAGEADAIITIGKVHDTTKGNTRYIHVPKNKLDGGLRSDEAHRHGFWEVTIKPEIARYEGTK